MLNYAAKVHNIQVYAAKVHNIQVYVKFRKKMSTKLWLIVRNSLFHNRGRTLKLTLMSLMLTTFIIQQFHHKYSGNFF